jgi:GntR family transcriptional regulator
VGTFVADWAGQFDLLYLPSFTAEMAAHDVRPATVVLDRASVTDAPEARAALRLGATEAVHVLTRVRRVGAQPIVLQSSYLGGALREVVERYTPDRSLYEMVREATGRAPLAAEETLCALALGPDAAALLAVESGAPGWIAARTTYDAEGLPLVYDEAFFPSERVELQLSRRAGQTRFEYRIKPGEQQ